MTKQSIAKLYDDTVSILAAALGFSIAASIFLYAITHSFIYPIGIVFLYVLYYRCEWKGTELVCNNFAQENNCDVNKVIEDYSKL